MIEQFLVAGTKIQWVKPDTVNLQPMNGAIVQNVHNFNPMSYRGYIPPNRHARRNYNPPLDTLIQHTWLDYIPGKTAYIAQGTDVLTGFMSGCLIARGNYLNGIKVFHLGTVENPNVNSLVKQTFSGLLQHAQQFTGFYPHAAWTNGERLATNKATDIISLVTSGGAFYSILLCHEFNNEYSIGGIRNVQPINLSAQMFQ